MSEPTDQFEPGLGGFSFEGGLSADHGRTPLDMLLSEFTELQRCGENVTVDDFARRHPELAGEIRELFPLVAAMERLKEKKEATILKERLGQDLHLERIGGCRIVRQLGRGGMGVVFEAIHETSQNRVAVKLLPWRTLDASRFREQFQREARLTAGLRHRNIVPVLDYGESDGFSYYVMQFIEGVGLDWIIQRLRGSEGIVYAEEVARLHAPSAGKAPAARETLLQEATGDTPSAQHRVLRRDAWPQIARIGLQVADALHYAHAAGTAHRDIKPANLLLDKDGRVWVTDFGLAQTIEHSRDERGEVVGGTLRYMAPEQLLGEFDQRSDVYALGMTLYELITQEPAFTERRDLELVRQISEFGPIPPRRHNPAIPVSLETIVNRAIARDPAERFQTAGELAGELRRFVNRQPLRTRRPSAFRRLLEWYRRTRAAARPSREL